MRPASRPSSWRTRGTDLYNPNAIRASLGAIFRVPVAAASARDVRRWLESHGARSSRRAWTPRCSTPAWITADRARLSWAANRKVCRTSGRGQRIQAIALPMRGIVDSLNVSVDGSRAVLRSAAAASRRSIRDRPQRLTSARTDPDPTGASDLSTGSGRPPRRNRAVKLPPISPGSGRPGRGRSILAQKHIRRSRRFRLT